VNFYSLQHTKQVGQAHLTYAIHCSTIQLCLVKCI